MPSTSAKQAKFMRAVAHSPKFAKKVGVRQSVGKDYEMADKKKMRKFASAGKVGRSAQEGIDKALANISASTPKPDMKDDTIAKATAPKKAPSFGEAFKAARAAGDKTFSWAGKSYGTQLASEVKKPAAASAPKVSTPKASAPTTNTRAQLEMRRTATRSQAAIREKRAENQADFRKRMQGKTAASAGISASRPKDKVRTGADVIGDFFTRQREREKEIGRKASKPKDYAAERAKMKAERAAREARMNRPYEKVAKNKAYAKGGSIDGCAVRGKTRAPLKKGK